MNILKGIIKEIYLPEEYIDGKLIDELYRKMIGFRIVVGLKSIRYETMQTMENCKLFKNQKVELIINNGKIIGIRGVE